MRCFYRLMTALCSIPFSFFVLLLVKSELKRWHSDQASGTPNLNRFADALVLKDAAIRVCAWGFLNVKLREYGHLDPLGYREGSDE